MEDKSKILEALKQYSLKSKNNTAENRDEVSLILKSVIANPTKYSGEEEVDVKITKELMRVLGELKEKNLREADKEIDEILKPTIH